MGWAILAAPVTASSSAGQQPATGRLSAHQAAKLSETIDNGGRERQSQPNEPAAWAGQPAKQILTLLVALC